MKRLWIAVAFLVIVLGACIWGQIEIKATCSHLSGLLEQTKSAAEQEDFPAAQTSAQELEQAWEKDYAVLTALIKHEELHDLVTSVPQLPELAEKEEKEELVAQCEESILRLEHIQKSEKPTWGNIF